MAKKIKWSIIQGAKLMFPFIEKCLSKIDSLNSIHASSTWQSDKKEELSLLEFYCLTHADKKIGRFARSGPSCLAKGYQSLTESGKNSLALIHHNYTYHVIITGMHHFKARLTGLFI